MHSSTRLGLGALAAGVLGFGLIHATAGEGASPDPACRDRDEDGFGRGCAAGPDCHDRNADIHPGQPELCDGRDNDCNALVDDQTDCVIPVRNPAPARVGAGAFIMGGEAGAPDERPAHRVEVSTFLLDRYEVTNARYRECVEAGACRAPILGSSRHRDEYYESAAFADYPVVFVDWHQAAAFCRFAGGRLPTEAEWEKAARGPAPSVRIFPWGDETPTCLLANFGGSEWCVGDTDLTGRRPGGASPYGALDMAGNVWEWVADWYDAGYYTASPATNPAGPARGNLKVMRGGCWESGASSLRVSCRKAELPAAWADNVGFRCAYPEGR